MTRKNAKGKKNGDDRMNSERLSMHSCPGLGREANGGAMMSRKVFWGLANLSLIMVTMIVMGCASGLSDVSQDSTTSELAFGYIHVETMGPHPRAFPTRLRFFSLTNEETGERFRIDVNSESGVFSMRLPAGRYVVDRVQFSEGPFRVESHVQLTFRVPKKKIAYLGSWQFEVETPRTVRLVRIRILEGDEEFSKKFSANLGSERTPIETTLPEPDTFEVRVFSVDPQPKVKYFRRR